MPKKKADAYEVHTPVLDATNAAIAAATHLTDMDSGAVATLRALALKIDVHDEYFEALAEQAEERKSRPPSVDNVSIPTYLKYCESLGLTPAGRSRADIEAAKGGAGGKLAQLRSVTRGKSA